MPRGHDALVAQHVPGRAQRIVARGVHRRDDAQHRAARRQAQRGRRLLRQARVGAAALQQRVEEGVPFAQLLAAQPRLLQPVVVHQCRRTRVDHPPDVSGRVQQLVVVVPVEPLPRGRQQSLPDHPAPEPVGPQHRLQRDPLAGAQSAGLPGGVLGVGPVGHHAAERLDAAFDVAAQILPQLVRGGDPELGVRGFVLQDHERQPVREALQILQQRTAERAQGLSGRPGHVGGCRALR